MTGVRSSVDAYSRWIGEKVIKDVRLLGGRSGYGRASLVGVSMSEVTKVAAGTFLRVDSSTQWLAQACARHGISRILRRAE